MQTHIERFKSEILDAHETLRTAYAARTPKSRVALEAACHHLPAGVTRSNLYFKPYPPTMERAEGAILKDVDGHEYIDFISDFAVAQSGHNNKHIAAALRDQLERGISYGARTNLETELAQLLQKRLPTLDKLRFANSGTEANLYAILTARAFTQKPAIFVFDGGYHGGALNFAMHDTRMQAPFETMSAPYNDIDAFRSVIKKNKDQLACVVMELMLNSGGCIPADPEFARQVETICRDNGILLIVDEVMTTRLGFHGLQGQYGMKPDLTTLGKIIGGGLPVGAFGGRAGIMAMFDQTEAGAAPHNGSFNNNVMTMTAGITAMSQVLTEPVLGSVNALGDELRRRLNQVFEARNTPLCFAGAGSVMALHIGVSPPDHFVTHPLAAPIRSLFHMHVLSKGVWIAQRGMVALSIETTEAHTDQFVEAVEDFVACYGPLLQRLAGDPALAGAA